MKPLYRYYYGYNGRCTNSPGSSFITIRHNGTIGTLEERLAASRLGWRRVTTYIVRPNKLVVPHGKAVGMAISDDADTAWNIRRGTVTCRAQASLLILIVLITISLPSCNKCTVSFRMGSRFTSCNLHWLCHMASNEHLGCIPPL